MLRNKYDYLIDKYRHRFLHEKFKDIAISRGDAPYLFRMVKSKTMKMNDLVGKLPFHKSHATRSINQLVKNGFIVKEVDPDDKRGYILSLTDKGAEIGRQVDNIFKDFEEILEEVLTPEDKKHMEEISKKLYFRLKEYYKEEDIDEEDF